MTSQVHVSSIINTLRVKFPGLTGNPEYTKYNPKLAQVRVVLPIFNLRDFSREVIEKWGAGILVEFLKDMEFNMWDLTTGPTYLPPEALLEVDGKKPICGYFMIFQKAV